MAKTKRASIKEPFVLKGEIIQIGAVKLDENLKVVGSFNAYIKPEFYRSMNKYVERVTLITDEMIAKGENFKSVAGRFREWCQPGDVILTWGTNDIPMLEDNLRIHKMDTSWIPESFDAQWMFDDQVTMEGRRYSLDYARFKFGIKGRDAHNALNDALNTADVIANLEVAQWIEEERAYLAEQVS